MNALRRKKQRLEGRFNALKSQGLLEQANSVKAKLSLVYYDIKEATNKSMNDKELRAIQKIKENSKYFYSYAQSLSRIKSSISMLYNKNSAIVTDPQAMANILQDQFSSVFSDPNSPEVEEPTFAVPPINSPLTDQEFEISDDSIRTAINAIPSDSAAGPDGIPVILLKQCALELCVPFRLIWAESFETGMVPKFYKSTQVTPLYKKGDRAHAINYRPVALTSHIIKVYERILRAVMVKFIDENKLLCDNQHGFRVGRSCLTQLLSHFDDVMSGMTHGQDTDAIYLDYAKAFDKVDHNLLIKKLIRYGFNDKIVNWVSSFLADRDQSVVVNGKSSYLAKILSGVPQGSVLGPLLFILFINDMQHCVMFSTIRFFADDTRILKHISCSKHVHELQEDLDSVVNWARKNNMALHEDKFEYMVYKHQPNATLYELPFIAEEFSYSISNGDSLSPVDTLKDLGVKVSHDLSWTPHIYNISSRARSIAAWALSAFRTRDKLTMLTLYKSLIRSHLEYCCPLWDPRKTGDIQEIESVQRSFTQRIWGVQHLDYWQRLKALGLMSLQRRRERYCIIHIWKILRGLVPNDLNVQFQAPSRLGCQAKVPKLTKSSSVRNQSIYDQSFAVRGPRLWNSLPANLHSIADLNSFKNNLTAFLLTIPDNPPVRGYSCANGNSILDWKMNEPQQECCKGGLLVMTR